MVSSSTASSTRSQTPDDKHKLFFDYADKTQEALSTFTELKKCSYASKELGNSNSHDFIECDCYEEFQDGVNHACGEDSDCINRLTLIECVNDLCGSCGNDCRNQRFQKREYADIAVFQTQKKGYGVRAQKDIEAHEFIYEYIGEVIAEDEFRDRMIDYDHRGLKHFYFMMLQTGEFIDATVKGSLARFCNHSCNPNAYVNKWAVAGKLRMGIFANRKILKGEEITFDYNVDRYGATAQPCYCDEPNCLGFLGGKTQTDAASLLPQNYADALGVRPSIEKKWIKLMKANGEKILKSEVNNINVEFVKSLDLSPCESLDDVSKVMSVLLQADDNLIIRRLMERILLTKDQTMHYQIIKLHGYRCFNKLLGIFEDDSEIQLEILEYLNCLPKTTKNGIISSQIDKKVEELKEKPELTQVSDELLAKWRSFETYKRITKKDISESSHKKMDLRRLRLPPGWEIIHENGKPVYYNAQQQTKLHHPPNGVTKTFGGSQPSRPSTPLDSPSNGAISSKKRPLDAEEYEKKKKQRIEFQRKELERLKNEELQQLKDKLELEDQKKTELEKIIAEANQQKELEKQQKFKEQQEEEQKRQKKLQQSKGDYMLHKWNRFFAGFVPNLVRHYEKDLGKDHIKECARDIVKTLSSKELKKDPKKSPPPEPSKEKKAKVREFTKVYMEKFSQKYAQRKKK
ncbi:histone methyltransferase SET2 [Lachancea thermotolerans CBS 6340]|uniref:Histone-lysine N-methyltransferase, H3 lysine-36 specific n=1 Tax=Lachancea thermotolerans (strain ATCC 56472 / CBS 6340 / NRRL Y-8284) TaxID=559295 RepID=C5DKG6_LACTC|nr:KLTH0F04510p [Lachancea thermotolerans CBS 6340]CAR23967.1 KLTH0F04510p [Lachancea thermotolerans CBS 6340]